MDDSELPDPEVIAAAAQILTTARQTGRRIDDLGATAPTSDRAAHAIADLHASQLGWATVGWKIGCTSEHARELLGSPGPIAGRVFDGTVYAMRQVDERALVHPAVECEFAFIIGSDIIPRDEPWTIDDVQANTKAVAPAIELIDSRFSDMTTVGYRNLIADQGANGGVVIGEPVPVAELPPLGSVEVTASVGGQVMGRGTGSDILGDPWNALVWLADHLSARRMPLRAGEFVMSGTCTGVTPLPVGSTAVGTYTGLGAGGGEAMVSITRVPGL